MKLSFRYFTVIYWMWASQTHYDLRFQANDTFHRITKVLQIVLFVIIGAMSSSWDLEDMQIVKSGDPLSHDVQVTSKCYAPGRWW